MSRTLLAMLLAPTVTWFSSSFAGRALSSSAMDSLLFYKHRGDHPSRSQLLRLVFR